MGIIAKIRGVVGGANEEELETYECQSCGAEYELPISLCEACGGDRIARVD